MRIAMWERAKKAKNQAIKYQAKKQANKENIPPSQSHSPPPKTMVPAQPSDIPLIPDSYSELLELSHVSNH